MTKNDLKNLLITGTAYLKYEKLTIDYVTLIMEYKGVELAPFPDQKEIEKFDLTICKGSQPKTKYHLYFDRGSTVNQISNTLDRYIEQVYDDYKTYIRS